MFSRAAKLFLEGCVLRKSEGKGDDISTQREIAEWERKQVMYSH